MPVSKMSAIERVARVLAGQRLSINAEGGDSSAGDEVDRCWEEHVLTATAVLKSLREPDEQMARVGDPDTWEKMVLAALADANAAP